MFSGDPAHLQRAALSAAPLLLLFRGVGPGLLLSQVRAAHFSSPICSFFGSLCSARTVPCSLKLLLHLFFYSPVSYTSIQPHCKNIVRNLNEKQIFLEMKRRGRIPSFYIYVSVSDLYIPTIHSPILLQWYSSLTCFSFLRVYAAPSSLLLLVLSLVHLLNLVFLLLSSTLQAKC